MGLFNKFHQFIGDLAHGIHDLETGSTDDLRVLFTNTRPEASDTHVDTVVSPCEILPSGAREIVEGNGYIKTGQSCGTITGAQVGGLFTMFLGTNPSWTATPAAMGTFRYAVLYNNSVGLPTARPLIGFYDYGSSIAPLPGEAFSLEFDNVNGVLTLQ